jgi:uncharacterized protein YbaR (Trm112 family)
MKSFSESELLDLWEKGRIRHPVSRALALMAATCPDVPLEQMASFSIGHRDAMLLRLRETLFGPKLLGVATCPECKERLELKFSTRDVLVGQEIREGIEGFSLDGCEIQFRLPNSLDLISLSGCSDLEKARHFLLGRCILSSKFQGNEVSIDKLPCRVRDAVVLKMEEIDPHADIQLDLSCPWCSHRWQISFDIVTFFWKEIDHWARRLLSDVHLLAKGYGWSESEILEMSPWRRQFYLEVIGK